MKRQSIKKRRYITQWVKAHRLANAKDKTKYKNQIIINRIRGLTNNLVNIHAIDKSSTLSKMSCPDFETFKKYIENQFKDGMNWQNRAHMNGWHFDHIIPLSSFNLLDPEQFKKAMHYTNLQPLWAMDNFKKSGKIMDNSTTLPNSLS